MPVIHFPWLSPVRDHSAESRVSYSYSPSIVTFLQQTEEQHPAPLSATEQMQGGAAVVDAKGEFD